MHPRRTSVERRNPIPIFAATAALLMLAWPAPGVADVLEGSDGPDVAAAQMPYPNASGTELAILEAMRSPQAEAKAIAIVGLRDPGTGEELAEIQRLIRQRLTSASS